MIREKYFVTEQQALLVVNDRTRVNQLQLGTAACNKILQPTSDNYIAIVICGSKCLCVGIPAVWQVALGYSAPSQCSAR